MGWASAGLSAGFVGLLVRWLLGGLRGEPFVEGDIEVEELLLVSVFVRSGVDHLDEELGSFERIVVKLVDVVEEIAGEGAVGFDRRAGEAKVVVVREIFLSMGS